MKRKWFALSAIAVIAMVGMFVLENIAAAHQPARNRRESRNVNRDRMARTVNPVSALHQSWIALSFGVKVDDETLAKARPIYLETREVLQTQINKARKADTNRETVRKIRETVKETNAKLNAGLKEILTEDQMTKLTELTQKRRTETRRRGDQSRRNQRESRRSR